MYPRKNTDQGVNMAEGLEKLDLTEDQILAIANGDIWVPYYIPDIISRAEALSTGKFWYFTGKPCKNGHIAKRSVKNYCCRKCAKIPGKFPPKQGIEGLEKLNLTHHQEVSLAYGKLWITNPVPDIISRKEAMKKGQFWYFTGNPCSNNHIAKRNTGSCVCRRCSHELTLRKRKIQNIGRRSKRAKAKNKELREKKLRIIF